MKPAQAQRIQWRGIASSHAAAAKLLRAPGDVSLIERSRPRWLLVKCPCGCGETISLNVDAGAGPAWRLYWSGSALSVFPSVWKEGGCESHFIIWHGRIDWLGSEVYDSISDELKTAVKRLLRPRTFVAYTELADTLSEIPWDVLYVCRELVREGEAIEGNGQQRGWFRSRA